VEAAVEAAVEILVEVAVLSRFIPPSHALL